MKFGEYSNVSPDIQVQLLKTYEESQKDEE